MLSHQKVGDGKREEKQPSQQPTAGLIDDDMESDEARKPRHDAHDIRMGEGRSSPEVKVTTRAMEAEAYPEAAPEPTAAMPTLPVDNTVVHAAIKEASQDIPRYLFRIWHPGSGGDSTLNSLTHVTPHAFKGQAGPGSIFDVDGGTLLATIQSHLTAHPVQTLFSSWSGSLAFVVSYASVTPDAHIAVIDTTQLPLRNNIHWCGSQCLMQLGIGKYPDEYHVFGIVSGPAYQALSFQHFKGEIVNPIRSAFYGTSSAVEAEGSDERRLAEAVRIGKQYNDKFALVIAAHLVSTRQDVSGDTNVVDRLLQEFKAPSNLVDELEESEQQPDVAEQSSEYAFGTGKSHGLTETQNAIALMRALINRQKGVPRLNPGLGSGGETQQGLGDGQASTNADQDVVMADRQSPDARRARNHIKQWERYPRAVRDLYISMVGAEEHNKMLEDG